MELTFKKKNTEINLLSVTKDKQKKLKILFRGWIYVPHSYAIVNCFQLVHLHKNFGHKIDIYVEEMPYYNPAWNNKRKLVYKDEYNEIIKGFKVYKNDSPMDFDLIYSQTYPYNINVTNNDINIPKCVFYTSEFAKIGPGYFNVALPPNVQLDTSEQISNYIKTFLHQFKNIYFTSPSVWSSQGMKPFILDASASDRRNRIITHGVDTTIFHYKNNHNTRDAIRKMYNVKDTDTLMISIGAMTKNKGILIMLQALDHIVNVEKRTNFKLLLKGTGDLYQSQQFLEIYFQELVQSGLMKKENLDNIMNYIIFTNNTLSFSMMNDLFNASDVYLAPYLAEGFCLAPLESLASGLHVIVPKSGSTKEYIQDIYKNGGSDFIHYVQSFVIMDSNNGNLQNTIEVNDLVKTILESEPQFKKPKDNYSQMISFIKNEYSWNKVSELLYEYFCDIVDYENNYKNN